MTAIRKWLTNTFLPIAVGFVILIALWWASIWIFGIRSFVLPSPWRVVSTALSTVGAMVRVNE